MPVAGRALSNFSTRRWQWFGSIAWVVGRSWSWRVHWLFTGALMI